MSTVHRAENEALRDRIIDLAQLRRRRQGVAVVREPLELPSAPNEVWSMDFVMYALADGCRLKVLTIVDDFTKEIG